MLTESFELSHPAGIHVVPGLKESQLLSDLPEVESTKSDMGTGCVWYSLPLYNDEDVIVEVSLGFNGGVLEMVMMTDAHNRFGKSWAGWSEKKERQRAASMELWLSKRGLNVGSYCWGSIWVGFDSKPGVGVAQARFSIESD